MGLGGVVVPGTLRDSLFILDVIHARDGGPKPETVITDTASYSDIVFGLRRPVLAADRRHLRRPAVARGPRPGSGSLPRGPPDDRRPAQRHRGPPPPCPEDLLRAARRTTPALPRGHGGPAKGCPVNDLWREASLGSWHRRVRQVLRCGIRRGSGREERYVIASLLVEVFLVLRLQEGSQVLTQ